MNDDLQHDAVDDELRRRFAAAGHAEGDPDEVLDALRPRLARARARRRASLTTVAAGLAAAVVVLVLVFGNAAGRSRSVHTPPASHGPVHTAPPTTTAAPSSDATTPAPAPAIDDGGSSGRAPSGSPEITTPDTAPTTRGAGETPAVTSPTTPVPGDREYTSAGGSIALHFADSQLSLVSNSPAPGYGAEVQDAGPSRVEVRFRNGTTEWRIRVDVVDGQLVPQITQH